MLLTRLELVIRKHQLRPLDIAHAVDFTRQYVLRVRLGLAEPSRRFILAVTPVINQMANGSVDVEDLFERGYEFLATRDARLRQLHVRHLRFVDDSLADATAPDWTDRLIAQGAVSETVSRHLFYIGKRQIDRAPAQAAAILLAASRIAAQLRNSPPELAAALQAYSLKSRANALRHLARYDDALADLRAAAELFIEARYCTTEAGQVHYTRATVLHKMERWADGAHAARDARRLFLTAKDARRITHADILLAVILYEQGEVSDARRVWLQLEKQLAALNDRESLARVWLNLAVYAISQGQKDDARRYLTRASSAFRALGNRTELARVRWNMANYLAAFKSRRAALFALERVRRTFDALGAYVDSACVGLDAIELMIPDARRGDAALTRYAQAVASTLVKAGLAISSANALDQLKRIAVARDRRAVLAGVRAALRQLETPCAPAQSTDMDEAETGPDLAPRV